MNLNSFDKKIIAHNFSKAPQVYDEQSFVQKKAAKHLIDLVKPLIKEGDSIIDLGSGTSALYKNLTSCLSTDKNMTLFELDLSLKMLQRWEEKLSLNIMSILGDGGNLPVKDASLDVIISSFALQWLENFEKAFLDFYRVLKKGGILAFCLPCNSSLKELKIANAASNCGFYFNEFPNAESLALQLKICGFEAKKVESQIIQSEFTNGIDALKSLKRIGANYSHQETDIKKPVSKKQLQHFNNICLNDAAKENKKFAISWDVSYFVFYKI